jgi:hypothetical protein
VSHLTCAVTRPHPLLFNTFIFNDLLSVKEPDAKREGLSQEKEIPVSRDVDGAKLTHVLIHDLRIEQAVPSGVQPPDE